MTIKDRATRRVLVNAKKALEKYGWIQGRNGDRHEGFCVVGAVYEASEHLRVDGGTRSRQYARAAGRDGAFRFIASEIDANIGYDGHLPALISDWNDKSVRKAQSALELIDSAIRTFDREKRK